MIPQLQTRLLENAFERQAMSEQVHRTQARHKSKQSHHEWQPFHTFPRCQRFVNFSLRLLAYPSQISGRLTPPIEPIICGCVRETSNHGMTRID